MTSPYKSAKLRVLLPFIILTIFASRIIPLFMSILEVVIFSTCLSSTLLTILRWILLFSDLKLTYNLIVWSAVSLSSFFCRGGSTLINLYFKNYFTNCEILWGVKLRKSLISLIFQSSFSLKASKKSMWKVDPVKVHLLPVSICTFASPSFRSQEIFFDLLTLR